LLINPCRFRCCPRQKPPSKQRKPSIIIFFVAIIRSWFPPERTKKILAHEREYVGNIMAALLGVVAVAIVMVGYLFNLIL
jgi:uncharacterized membrane protein YraQ (UPF0718 family)